MDLQRHMNVDYILSFSKRYKKQLFLGGFAAFCLLLIVVSKHHENISSDWSPFKSQNPQKQHHILFNPQNPQQCAFLNPFEGLSKKEQKLGHTRPSFIKNGEVYPAPGEEHPLFYLLKSAVNKFSELAQRQSQTLEQAVQEYKRRYNREPPKGFDKWWEYVVENEVLFKDEFDEIENSLKPFRGMSKEEVKERFKEAQGVKETVTLKVKDGKGECNYNPGSTDDYWTHRRTDPQLNLINLISHNLPDFEMIFGLRDEPQIMVDYEVRDRLLHRADLTFANQHHTLSALPQESDHSRFNYPDHCPPLSPLRSGSPSTPTSPSFITKQSISSNPCYQPNLVNIHGFFIDHKTSLTMPKPINRLLPIMVLSKTTMNDDILGIYYDDGDWLNPSPDTQSWSKKDERLYWRGHSTGMVSNKANGERWRNSHRQRLHRFAHPILNSTDSDEFFDLLVADEKGQGVVGRVTQKKFLEWAVDISMSGNAMQCDEGDGTCQEMRDQYAFVPEDPGSKAQGFKYLFDIDGNAWTSRFRRLMLSSSLVLKSTVFPEFNAAILPEWFAYAPVKLDYTDVPSIMRFFRDRDEVARRIAWNGRCWAERTWRKEDMVSYAWRLYLEWAEISS